MADSVFNPDYQEQHVEAKIVASLARLAEAFRTALWQQSKEWLLSPIQTQILIFLNFHDTDKNTVTSLAKEFSVTKATISDAIKTLETKELIVKIPSQFDERSYTIDLTKTGSTIVQTTALFANDFLTPFQGLSEEEKASFLRILLDLLHYSNQNGFISVQRLCYSCQHHGKNEAGETYCSHFQQSLTRTGIRIDCPAYQQLTP